MSPVLAAGGIIATLLGIAIHAARQRRMLRSDVLAMRAEVRRLSEIVSRRCRSTEAVIADATCLLDADAAREEAPQARATRTTVH